MPDAVPNALDNYKAAASANPTSAEAQSNLGWGQYGQHHKHPDYADCDHASQTPFAKRHDLWMMLGCQLTLKLSCGRSAHQAAHRSNV